MATSYLQPRQDPLNTLSSWDNCMSETYCKWPVIAAIILGSILVLSIIWCIARCLCCGLEACCGCFSCCNSCCPSPRRSRKDGYEQPMPPPQFHQFPPQYGQPAAPMMYGPSPTHNPPGLYGGYRGATATFDSPSTAKSPTTYNEDALPAMPSWGAATSRRVEASEDVEMANMDNAQQQSLLAQQQQQPNNSPRYYGQQQDQGDLGAMAASPYYNDDKNPYGPISPYSPPPAFQQQQQQQYPQPQQQYSQQTPQPLHRAPSSHYTTSSPPPSTIHAPQPMPGYARPPSPNSYYASAPPPPSTVYNPSPVQAYPGQSAYPGQQSYETSAAPPPSYRTAAPSLVAGSPPAPAAAGPGAVARKPVGGSWRDV
ncbi:hypothetical protein MBLNU230_g7502t1 [Neophaeotheca triangularis]